MEDIIIIGDFLKDLDDEHSLVAACALAKRGLINIRGVVGNLAPANIRARAAKGTLKLLRFSEVPVGIGTPVFVGKTHPYEVGLPYLSKTSEVLEDGERLMVEILNRSANNSVTLVLQSGLTDAYELLKHAEHLFLTHVKRVVIMGGVEVEDGQVKLDANGFMTPNNANNNSFDMSAAQKLYKRLQELRIPTITVTREVAYAAQADFSMYEKLVATGSLVGKSLAERQIPSLQSWWKASCSPSGSEIRGTFPDDRDREWFIKVFCDGIDPGIDGDGDIGPFIKKFNLYDPTALYAAVPGLLTTLYTPTEVVVRGVAHLVIGVSKENNGVKDPAELRRFMTDIEVEGLQGGSAK